MACTTGTSHWDKHNLSQWDRQIGTSCACPSGTSTACPNLDWERSKETSDCPMGQVIYPRWRPFLVPGQALYPRWSLSQFHLSQLVPQSGSTRPCSVLVPTVVSFAKQGTETETTYGPGRPGRLPEAKNLRRQTQKKLRCGSASESVFAGILDQIFQGFIDSKNVFSDAEVLEI